MWSWNSSQPPTPQLDSSSYSRLTANRSATFLWVSAWRVCAGRRTAGLPGLSSVLFGGSLRFSWFGCPHLPRHVGGERWTSSLWLVRGPGAAESGRMFSSLARSAFNTAWAALPSKHSSQVHGLSHVSLSLANALCFSERENPRLAHSDTP